MPNQTTPSWYVLYTLPNHEKKVYEGLIDRNIKVFLPLKKEIRVWSDRKKTIEVPLFPNYLFVNLRVEDRYEVFKTYGILRYIGSNKHPTALPDKEIDLIRKIASEKVEITNENFKLGTKILITSGPLKGIQGLLTGKRGSNRLLVVLSHLKKNVLVDVSPYYVKTICTPLNDEVNDQVTQYALS